MSNDPTVERTVSNAPYYQVLIDHSPNRQARDTAATMEKTAKSVDGTRVSVWARERDWWSSSSEIVKVSVSFTPFDDTDGSKYARTRDFADRLAEILGVEVRIHNNID